MSDNSDLLNIMGLGEFSVKKNYYNELEREKVQFERIFSEALNGIIQAELSGDIIITNPALWKMCEYVDYRDLTVSCKNIGDDLFFSKTEFNSLIKTLKKEEKVVGYETQFKKANQEPFYISLDAHIQNDRGSEILELFIQDIDKRKKVEEEFKSTQRLNENILNASILVSIISTDVDGLITQFNKGAELMLGYKAADVVGIQTPELFHSHNEIIARGIELSEIYNTKIEGFEVFVRKARYGGSEEREWTYIKKNGERITVNLAVTAIHDDKSNIIGFLGVAKDVTLEKKSQWELIEAKKMVNSIIDSMPSIIIGVDSFISIILWNKEAELVTGICVKEALGQNPFVLFPELVDLQDKIIHKIDNGEIYIKKKIPFLIKNTRYIIDITVYPIDTKGLKGGVIRIDDVTEQVRLEELIVQSEKMLSVGGLAAGMAHEINNPLAGIIQNTQNLERRLFSPLKKNIETAEKLGIDFNSLSDYMQRRDIEKMLGSIQNSVLRASRIVKNMLSFARKSNDSFYFTSLPELLESTVNIAESDYSLKKDFDFKGIDIHRDYSKNLPEVLCDPSKIQQVFYNILKNGAEAMEYVQNPKFNLRIYTFKKWVICEIEDNGHGISEKSRKRIFEPFYTTKEVGKGTGLGMSVSYFIISELHHGELTVESCLKEWTRFIIKLPIKGVEDE